MDANSHLAELEELLGKTRIKEKRVEILNALAYELREADTARAAVLAEEAFAIAEEQIERTSSKQRKQQYKLQQAKALYLLCFCLRSTDRADEAESYGKRAMEIFAQLGEGNKVAETRYCIAYIYLFRHEVTIAMDLYEQSYRDYEHLNNLRGMIATLHGMANILWRQKDYDKAQEYFERCITTARVQGWTKELVVSLIGLGNVHQECSRFAQALSCYQESITLCRSLSLQPRLLAGALVGIGGVYKILGNYPAALRHAQEATELFRQVGNYTGAATSLELLSGLYIEQCLYEEAIACCTETIQLLQGTGYKKILAGAWNNLASVYAHQGNYQKSIEHFERAFDIYTDAQDLRGICFVPANIAEQYYNLGQLDSARHHILSALASASTHSFLDIEIEIIPVFGRIALALGQFNEALAGYHSTLQRCKELQHQRGIALLSALAGDVYKEQQQYTKALSLYEQAIRAAQQGNSKFQMVSLHHSLYVVHEALGNIPEALHWFKEYHRIDKEVFNESSDKRIQNLLILHETETAQKERDIFRLQSEQLKTENELKAKELSAMALHLVQKNEMLESLRLRAKAIVESYAEKSRKLAEEMIQQIESNIREDNSWTSFNQQFTQLHSDFVQTLSERYPTLTPMELKICALLKIQLSTKEIAAALVLSARTVEDHRNRMRKKFGLKKDENLATFLAAL